MTAIPLNIGAQRQQLLLAVSRQIQFKAKGALQRQRHSGLHGRNMAGAMIRNTGKMGTHNAAGIKQTCAILDIGSGRRIRIVTAPDLRTEIQHAAVKASAAAGTVFQKKGGIFFRQSPLQLIDTQHIPVINLSLSAGRQRRTVYIGQASVHIPLQILDGTGEEDLIQHLPDAVHHLYPGKIQGILVTDGHRLPSRNVQRPVRMLSVKITFRADGLRLHPKAKVQSQVVDLPAKPRQTLRQLILVGDPVT